jgi:hypothetical protein
MDIYSVLSSKSHNLHYLNRYIKFIENCLQKNADYSGPVENHHICPQADDMFPEYSCLETHFWNKAPLTPRQHFIAHLMLWKAYPNTRSQSFAAWSMKHKNDEKINSRLYESLKEDFRKLSSKIHKDKVVVKDEQGKTFKVHVDDPRFISGELKALTLGHIGVKDNDGNTFRVSVDDPRYLSGELVAITKGMSWKIEDTINYKKPKSQSHVENMKKWASVTDPETMERKRVLRTDPLYVSGYYKGPSYGIKKTEEQRKEISERFKGNKQIRCSCVICKKEISANNLVRHHGSKLCLKEAQLNIEDFTELPVSE